MFPQPYDPQDEAQGQLEYKTEPGNQPPKQKPGDKFIVGGALVGITIGTAIGLKAGKPVFWLAGFFGGSLLGIWTGVLINNLVKRRGRN